MIGHPPRTAYQRALDALALDEWERQDPARTAIRQATTTNQRSGMSLTEAGTTEAPVEETGTDPVQDDGFFDTQAEVPPETPADTPADPDPPALDDIIVPGTAQLSMFNMGGKLPQSSTLKFTGGKVALQEGTAFKKGETVVVRIVAVVNEVTQKDAHDAQTGQVVSCEQRHSARITDMVIEG